MPLTNAVACGTCPLNWFAYVSVSSLNSVAVVF